MGYEVVAPPLQLVIERVIFDSIEHDAIPAQNVASTEVYLFVPTSVLCDPSSDRP